MLHSAPKIKFVTEIAHIYLGSVKFAKQYWLVTPAGCLAPPWRSPVGVGDFSVMLRA